MIEMIVTNMKADTIQSMGIEIDDTDSHFSMAARSKVIKFTGGDLGELWCDNCEFSSYLVFFPPGYTRRVYKMPCNFADFILSIYRAGKHAKANHIKEVLGLS